MSHTNRLLPTLAVALACLSLTASSAVAQSYRYATPPQPTPYRSAKTLRQADRLERYQMRAQAAEAVAAAQRANAMIGVAARVGKYEAAGALREAEATYRETCVATGQRKLDAMQALAPINEEKWDHEIEQAQARNVQRVNAAHQRVAQVQTGDWPVALLGESFRPLRDELSLALAGRPGFVGHRSEVNVEHAVSLAGQIREELRIRVRELPQPEYARASRFLEELKLLRLESVAGDRT